MAESLLSLVRAQEGALRTIQRALESGQVHHAYLFAGPDGVGKELAAFGLAQALVCETRGSTQSSLFGGAGPPSFLACGVCSACLRAVPREDERRPLHPDIVVVERGLYAPQAIGRRTPETQDISIDQIRTLVLSRAAYAPHEGRAKVILVRRAEEMSVSAANALLKTLEEPGPRTHFILLTSEPDALLPTILSRTLRVRFAPLPDDVVESILEARGVDTARAREVARLSGGSIEAGEHLADPEESEARAQFVSRALEAVRARGLEPLLAIAEDAKKDKGELRSRIRALATAYAEMAANAARDDTLPARQCLLFATSGRLALAALEQLDFNNAPQMVVESMLSRIRAL